MKKLLYLCMIALIGVSCNLESENELENNSEFQTLIGLMEENLDYDVEQAAALIGDKYWTHTSSARYTENWGEVLRVGFAPGTSPWHFKFNADGTAEMEHYATNTPEVDKITDEALAWAFDPEQRILEVTCLFDGEWRLLQAYHVTALGARVMVLDYLAKAADPEKKIYIRDIYEVK